MKEQVIVAKDVCVSGIDCVRYELIDKRAETSFFYISDIHSAIKANYETLQKGMHCHTFFSVLWFFSGEGTHIVDSRRYKIEANTVFFLSPKQLHTCCDLENIEGITLGFSEDFLLRLNAGLQEKIKSNLFETTNEVAYCKMPITAKEKFMPVIKGLREASLIPCEDNPLQADYIASLLSSFLIDVIRMGNWGGTSMEDNNTNMFQIHQKFIKAVDNKFKKYHNVDDYLDVLGTSRTYLNICARQYSKNTPLRLIQNRIIAEAKRMLLYGKLSIKEISFDLGFNDVSYFIRFFKRNEGITPLDFRNMNKGCSKNSVLESD